MTSGIQSMKFWTAVYTDQGGLDEHDWNVFRLPTTPTTLHLPDDDLHINGPPLSLWSNDFDWWWIEIIVLTIISKRYIEITVLMIISKYNNNACLT